MAALHACIVAALGVMLCAPSTARAATRETSAAVTPSVPLAIREAQDQAIRIFDAARAEQWGLADRTAEHLAATIVGIRSDTRGDSADVDELDTRTKAMRKTIVLRDRLATMRAANDLTLLTADLSEPYGPRVPVDVDRLEAYGRAAIVASDMADLEQLRSIAGEVQKTWQRLHQAALERGDIDDVRKLDTAVNELAHASHVSEYRQAFMSTKNAIEGIRRSFM
jgi:hypothetical protein